MFSIFKKSSLLACAAALMTLSAVSSFASEWDDCCEPTPCDCNRLYIGGFGGWLFPDSARATQIGNAFFDEDAGGPLTVFANGRVKGSSTGFGGVQVGYEWSKCVSNCDCPSWAIAPALEAEAVFYSHKRKGHLFSDVDFTRLEEHDFYDSFRANTTVLLGNVVLSLNNSLFGGALIPYVGGGIGAARLSLHSAKSFQVQPPEEGINHFNSRTNDSAWTFAAQAKAGLRYKIFDSLQVFVEYRYLYIDSSNYIFGPTIYHTQHVPTSAWNVKLRNLQYNAVSLGLQYSL